MRAAAKMLKKVLLALIVALGAHFSYKFFLYEHPVPTIDHDAFWGRVQPQPDDPTVRPFKIEVPDSTLKNLEARLDFELRYQPSLEGTNFEYGINPEVLKKFVDFWRNKYNWREREAKLNKLPQYATQVSGLDIHFVHAKPEKVPAGMKVVPLLLLHGWPGSVKEFHAMIPLLTKPRDGVDFVFEVIAPSLPGYGFSQAAAQPGLSTDGMAVIFKKLMSRLGYEKFYLQGGDWGSLIATDLATIYPDSVMGLHLNMCGAMSMKASFYLLLSSVYPPLFMDQEIASTLFPLSDFYSNLILEAGYFHLQATKPDTIGVALTNSPIGLAAYILEKFSTWTNPAYRSRKDGGITEKYSMEDLLDNIMLYWLSGNVASSMRLYSEVFSKRNMQKGWDDVPCKVPTVCARFPNELIIQPDFIVRVKYPNLLPTPARDHPDYEVHRPPRGGHFAAFEEPELLATSIFKGLNAIAKKK